MAYPYGEALFLFIKRTYKYILIILPYLLIHVGYLVIHYKIKDRCTIKKPDTDSLFHSLLTFLIIASTALARTKGI